MKLLPTMAHNSPPSSLVHLHRNSLPPSSVLLFGHNIRNKLPVPPIPTSPHGIPTTIVVMIRKIPDEKHGTESKNGRPGRCEQRGNEEMKIEKQKEVNIMRQVRQPPDYYQLRTELSEFGNINSY